MVLIQAVSVGFHLPWTAQQRKAKKPLDYICQMEWLLFFQTCQKYFINPCFSLQLVCIPVCSCQWLMRDQLELISFPALLFGLSSFPSLRIFAVEFPPAGVLAFCFTFKFSFPFATSTFTVDCFLGEAASVPCSRWHQVVKWQRIDWIIIWFDPVTSELSPVLQQVPKVCAGIAALQHNSHLAVVTVGITVIPQGLYQWRITLKSWRREDELNCSLSPHVSLGQSCLSAINWKAWLCWEARELSTRW